ncbi:MAG: sodium:calcium antiporter [Dehalococcoidia bacterium]
MLGSQILVWLQYLACLAIILFAGTKLARYGDAIGEKTGVGGLWIGLVLLAAITSVPELVTGVSSVALVGLPDLAVGTLLGSCLFNLTLIALLDFLCRKTPVLSRVRMRHIASAAIGVVLLAVVGGTMLAGEALSAVKLGWVGVPSILIIIFYLVAVRQLFVYERRHPVKSEGELPRYDNLSLKAVWFRFSLAAAAVIGAGIWISFVGDDIAASTGWGASFVGSLFLAIGTSMPELVVTVAALRLGATDMAVADILGSNMFNIAIIFAVDLFYTKGSILSSVANSNLITVAMAITASLLIIFGLRFRRQRKLLFFSSWYSPPLLALYVLGAYFLFRAGIGL